MTIVNAGSGVAFPDASLQTTAGLPLTGGTAIGDIIAPNLTATYGITASTMTVSAALTAGSSVTASDFFGDGSHLTGVSGGDVYKASTQTFTGSNTFGNTAATTTTQSTLVIPFGSGLQRPLSPSTGTLTVPGGGIVYCTGYPLATGSYTVTVGSGGTGVVIIRYPI